MPIDNYSLFLSLLIPQQLSLTKNEYHIYTIRGLTTQIFSFFKRGIMVKIGINIKEILTNNLKSKIMKIFNIVFTMIHKQVGCLGPRYRQNIDKKSVYWNVGGPTFNDIKKNQIICSFCYLMRKLFSGKAIVPQKLHDGRELRALID